MAAPQRGHWKPIVLLFALLAGPAWAQEEASTLQERILAVSRATDDPSTITVIRLKHRKAEELAETLRRVVPSDVTIVADPPTNSLIISGPPPAPTRPVAAGDPAD